MEASLAQGAGDRGRRKASGLQTYKYLPAAPQTSWEKNVMSAEGPTRVWR